MDKFNIQKGDKVLEVNERLFRVYYKGLGYAKVETEAAQVVDDNNEGDDVVVLSMDNTKDEIIAELERQGVEHNPKDKKEELLKLLGVE